MKLWPQTVWQTDLSVAECQSRLARVTDKDSVSRWFRFADRGTVYSTMTDRSFRLFAKGSAFIRNSFEPYLYGSFVQTQRGTTLLGVFRPHTFVLAFMAVWFAFVSVGGGLMSVVSLVALATGRVPQGTLSPGLGLFIGPALVGFGIAIVAVGWRLGRGQRERMRTLVDDAFRDRLTRGCSGPAA